MFSGKLCAIFPAAIHDILAARPSDSLADTLRVPLGIAVGAPMSKQALTVFLGNLVVCDKDALALPSVNGIH
jgi:hypothetical protein